MAITAQYDVAVYDDSYYDLLVLNCSGGSYNITGGNATFLYNQAIQAGAGSYTLTGNAASFIYDQVLQGNAGSYTLTGQDAGLDYDQLLNCEAGSFTLTGNSATFLYDQTIYAGAFSFIWSGQQAGLIKDAVLDAEAGAYTLTGNAAALLQDYSLSCEAGNFVFTGKSAALSFNPIVTWGDKGGIGKKKKNTKLADEKQSREELEAIVKREFDILDGTYEPEVVEVAKQQILPQIKEIDYTQYAIAIAQVNALLLQAKIAAADYQAELDDEEALLMLL